MKNGMKLLSIESDLDDFSAQDMIRSSNILPKSTAYILQTSGSTGTPKAIVVSHSSCSTALTSLISRMKFGQHTRILQFASFAFDASIFEIFAPLISGSYICMVSDSQRLDGDLAHLVRYLRVNFLLLTPTLASVLEPTEFPSLHTLVLVGKLLTRQVVERWTCIRPTMRIWNAYGPAEAGFMSCVNTSVAVNEPANVGRPVGCHLFITDLLDSERLAAIGAIGELVICGENVADGYLEDLEDTSKSFCANPSWILDSYETPICYYKTGDLARNYPDGSLQVLRRKDLQRKIHSQRLELSEIECQIMNCYRIHGMVVELFSPSTLIAFLKIEKSHGTYTGILPPGAFESGFLDRLANSLRLVLPLYMVPSAYVPIRYFPTNASGKTDRNVLRSSVEKAISTYQHGKTSS